ncbi:HlyD family secretion protein [Pseudohalioglobus sediminis]|uniref:HlyD family secretion protein n=1 Tax=Pseudohalioglobus sediminis TaxID=2606449 RepID=UPI00165EFC7F|nr:efflux RND transporter periplasmic adaptor subunit [Pseudohalioglobus sediminis]
MIAFISIIYASLYIIIFNKLGLLKKTVGNICAFAGVGVVMIAAIVFMWYTFAPISNDARMFRYIIPIVPNVRGEVVEVPIQALQPLEAGDVLFKIDPEPFEIAVRQLTAQVNVHEAERRLAEVNVERAKSLLKVQAAAQIDLDTWTANRDKAIAAIEATEAQLDNARWQLQETVVRAPGPGHVVNLQVRPGNVVTTVPVASPMAFVSDETNTVLASFSQSAVRRINVGDEADVVFVGKPGQTFAGKVERIVAASGQSQMSASGQLPSFTGAPVTDRWAVAISLDDEELARSLPQGTAGTVAVYTNAGKPVHVISKVAMRMSAWLSYLTSP